jgi:hypothetical protein
MPNVVETGIVQGQLKAVAKVVSKGILPDGECLLLQRIYRIELWGQYGLVPLQVLNSGTGYHSTVIL